MLVLLRSILGADGLELELLVVEAESSHLPEGRLCVGVHLLASDRAYGLGGGMRPCDGQ